MKSLSFCILLLLSLSAFAAPPNYIVIFCDDLGYGDLGCYGSTKNRTPHIDQLAKDGMSFTDFYVSSPVCTPSRASLLTGSYARRVGMHEDFTEHWVLIPRSRRGLNPDEVTLPEMLKDAGYATTCIGKWHLGDQPEHLPTRHGFDSYYGIPYSNDMASAKRGDPPLPIVRDEKVIEAPCDQSTLTKRYTAEAIKFIEASKDKPFFLYLPHTFPHLPLFASPDFKNKSKNGRYGDSIEEIDWSTGEILKCLERLMLVENTVVIFTSDNGSNGRNGGSNLPLAGNKGGTMEGGMRVPMIVRWPGNVPKGSRCSELATTMDLLPTFAALSKAKLPTQKMDGHDISDLLLAKAGAKSPHEAFYYYRRRQLQAIRWGKWKWHLPLEQRFKAWSSIKGDGRPVKGRLIDLEADLKETTDVSAKHPEVMAKLAELAAKAVADLGNEEKNGAGQRAALTLDSSKPMVLEK
jgi:arylsulfatase A-like enzyme